MSGKAKIGTYNESDIATALALGSTAGIAAPILQFLQVEN